MRQTLKPITRRALAWLIAANIGVGVLADEREIVFKSDFASGLDGWFDVFQWNAANVKRKQPNPEWYRVVREGGETFLRTKTMFGISSLLKREIIIADPVSAIELSVTFRAPNDNNHQVCVALTSRECPAGADGGPFWLGHQDNGIMARGYQHSIQHANLIAWQKAGRQVWMSPPRPPYQLLRETGEWVTWRLVYSRHANELAFYRDAAEKEPYLIQRNALMEGAALNSVWISAWGVEYRDITVTLIVDRKDKDKGKKDHADDPKH